MHDSLDKLTSIVLLAMRYGRKTLRSVCCNGSAQYFSVHFLLVFLPLSLFFFGSLLALKIPGIVCLVKQNKLDIQLHKILNSTT